MRYVSRFCGHARFAFAHSTRRQGDHTHNFNLKLSITNPYSQSTYFRLHLNIPISNDLSVATRNLFKPMESKKSMESKQTKQIQEMLKEIALQHKKLD